LKVIDEKSRIRYCLFLVLLEKPREIFRKYFVGTFLLILSTKEAFLQDDPYGSLKLEASPNSFGIQVLALIGNNFAIEIIDFFI
jgi:hypothetical protein